ncbi:MAG: hypothetical protein RLZZ505_2291 [Verrucomicrobiota bacterium]|jgi:hypothetical protein
MTTPQEIIEMRQFLARVMRTSIFDITITGDPANDRNADLVRVDPDDESGWVKLCPIDAIEIDTLLEHESTVEEGARRFHLFKPPHH